MDEIIRVQVINEREKVEGDLQWDNIIKERRMELSCVYQKMAQIVGWQLGRPCRLHAPKPSEQRQKAMITRRGGHICFYPVRRTLKKYIEEEESTS